MTRLRDWNWRYILAIGALCVAVGGIGTLLFAFSGIYNVAASQGHWWITNRLLTVGMRASVRTHSLGIERPALNDPNMVRLGAAHFEGGCAVCHGSPLGGGTPIAAHMLPQPPRLDLLVPHWDDEELFWIVKHGLKYTSMPGWVGFDRNDEIWAVVAFLRQLPGMGTAKYSELAKGGVPVTEIPPQQLVARGAVSRSLTACGNCHGIGGQPPLSNLVPRLDGQPEEYLYRQLAAYAKNMRQSGYMEPVAAALDAAQMREIARFYANSTPVPGPESDTADDPQRRKLGHRIATQGVPERGIPACDGCHNAQATALYPRLRGQHGAYLAAQLRLWQTGGRREGDLAAIMMPIAQRLTEEETQAVAHYYDSLPPASGP